MPSITNMERIGSFGLSRYFLLACLLHAAVFRQASAFKSLHKPASQVHLATRSKVRLYEKLPAEGDTQDQCESRRTFFDRVAAGFAIPASLMVANPSMVQAASPVTLQETDSIGAMAKRALRAKPPKILRRKLTMEFAVLLMRSSYSSLDKLDCVAMDQFQRDFFLIRSSEYEPYIGALGPGVVQQGDLTDPNYFDFISYAQYRTINREISRDPPFVFEEQQSVDQGEDQPAIFVPVVVRRDPTMTNAMLGPEHERMVGSAILDRFEEIFADTDIRLPKIEPGSRPDAETLRASLKQLLNLFLINGYALSGTVAMTLKQPGLTSGTTFQISLVAPATLWSGKVLQADGEKLSNDFFMKAATELLRRSGYRSSYSIVFNGSTEELSISVV